MLYSIWDQYHDHPDGERKEIEQIFLNDNGEKWQGKPLRLVNLITTIVAPKTSGSLIQIKN